MDSFREDCTSFRSSCPSVSYFQLFKVLTLHNDNNQQHYLSLGKAYLTLSRLSNTNRFSGDEVHACQSLSLYIRRGAALNQGMLMYDDGSDTTIWSVRLFARFWRWGFGEFPRLLRRSVFSFTSSYILLMYGTVYIYHTKDLTHTARWYKI